MLEAIARGLYRGADEAGIAIPGGEIAQIGAMLADSAGGGPMLDLVGTAVGAIPDGRAPVDGSAVRPGDVVLALPSSGLHSNGYSLARRALGARTGELADALLAPTRVYVRAAEALWAAGITPRGLAHISGGGLLNLARLAADVSYTLDALPPAPEIFALIAVGRRHPGRDHVRHLQHGHRLLRRRLPGRRPRRARRPDRRGGAARRGRLGHRPPGPLRVDPAAGLLGRGDVF